MTNIKIAPSMLSSDFSIIGDEIYNIDRDGADVIHLDVMDGVFVKNITFGPKFIKDVRKYSDKVFDAHLMIENPWKYIDKFAEAGADIITVHYEAEKERLSNTLKAIKGLGVKCGAVINPDTPVSKIYDIIEKCDVVVLMSVFPGFGGQKFIPEVLDKICKVKAVVDSVGKDVDIEIDGGITCQNVRSVKDAGANIIVAGSTIFNEKDRASVIKALREI